MSETNVFQRDKIPFQMLGREFYYEFIPSIHFQEIMTSVARLLTSLSIEDGDVTGIKDDALLPYVLEVVQDILAGRIYQVIADILQYQNDYKVSVYELKMGTRPLEIAGFLDLLIRDPEIHEAIVTLGKSLAALTGKLGVPSAMTSSTPSSPTTSDSTTTTSTGE